jgi:hypothetical protein
MTMDGLEKYYRNRGYSPNPLLEDRQDADLTFVKPLPDGRRMHLRINKGRKYINIEEHVDKADPNRNPIGHIFDDVLSDDVKHEKYRIPLRKKRPKKTRKKRSK